MVDTDADHVFFPTGVICQHGIVTGHRLTVSVDLQETVDQFQ
jgi:hypothetical protein